MSYEELKEAARLYEKMNGRPMGEDEAEWFEAGFTFGVTATNTRIAALEAQLAAQAVGVPVGWKLVPAEPTKDQWRAGIDAWNNAHGTTDAEDNLPNVIYAAMLTAAPAPAENTPAPDLAKTSHKTVETRMETGPHGSASYFPAPVAGQEEKPALTDDLILRMHWAMMGCGIEESVRRARAILSAGGAQ
jgi:hypothetical protein